MNNNQPTQQEPSFNSDIGHQQQQVQYVPYNQQVQYVPYGYPQQANIYPWAAGMMMNHQIPMNQQVNGVVPTPTTIPIVHQSNDIELQEQPMNQQLIPSSTNQEEPTNNTSEPNACTRKACSWQLRCKKHAEQKRFWRSLNRKTWTRLPRAVGVLGILFVVLSIAFFLTIGKSVDNHYLNYRKSQCQINTNAANSIVHFDFDQGLYYVNLNVSVAGNDRRFGGNHNHEQEPNKPEANHQRKSPLAPNTNTYIQRKPSFIMYRVCSSPMQQMAADCRDRILQQTQLTCFVNQQAMKRVERAERFGGRHQGTHKDDEKKPEEPVPQPTPVVEKKTLEVEQPRPDQNRDDRQTLEAEVNGGHRGRFSGQNLIVTRDTVKQEFHHSLHCSVPAFIIVSLIFIAVFIAVGFKVLEGKSKFSFDRFFRQYFKNPFGATGEVYQLDEISSSAVVIQDQNEPKFRTLLSASTLKMENTPRQERLLQKRLSKFWTLMRSTATSANETLFLYEKVARANIGCHAKKKAACNGKRKFGRALCIAFKIFLVLIIAAIVIYTSFKTVSSFTNRRVFTGFLFLDATLAILGLFVWFGLFKRRSVHYIITSQRIAKVIELPFRLKMTLMSVDFSKVKGVWAEENKIHLKTVNSKGVERSGLMFEHVIDPNFVVTLIQQKISNNTTTTEPQPTTESVATTTETH